MPPLADIQAEMRRALVFGETDGVVPILAGGGHFIRRLEIHQRQYVSSLVSALLGKFPATIWLVGERLVAAAARDHVRRFPPQAPCIAEYGEDFPRFLATHSGAERIPYLRRFAELEWHAGHVSIGADATFVSVEQLAAIPADVLPSVKLCLQSGARYLQAEWPVDELIKLYLTESAPDRLEFEPAHVWLEIRGSRGEFNITRLDAPEFAFRESLKRGLSITNAVENALAVDPAFEPDSALVTLLAGGLIAAIEPWALGEKLGERQ